MNITLAHYLVLGAILFAANGKYLSSNALHISRTSSKFGLYPITSSEFRMHGSPCFGFVGSNANFGVAVGVGVGTGVGVGIGVGVGVGEVVGVGIGFTTVTPLLHTNFFPLFTQVNFFPAVV